MDVQLEEGRGGFKERSVAVGKQAALQKQLQDLQRSYQDLTKRYEAKDQKCDELRGKFTATKAALSARERELETAQRLLQKSTAEKGQLKEEYAERQVYTRRLEAKLEELQGAADLTSKYQAAKQKAQEQQQALATVTAELQASQELSEQRQKEINRLSRALDIKVTELSKEFGGSEDVLAQLLHSLAESREESLLLAKQLATTKSDLAKHRASASKLSTKLETEQLLRTDAEQAAEQLKQRLEKLLEGSKEASKQRTELTQQLATSRSEAGALKREKDELAEVVLEMQEELDQLKAAAAQVAAATQDAAAAATQQLRRELEEARAAAAAATELQQQRAAQLTARCTQLADQAAQLESALQQQVLAAQQTAASRQQQILVLEAQLQTRRQRELDLEQQVAELQARVSQLSGAFSSAEAANRQTDHLARQVARLEAALRVSSVEKQQLQQRLAQQVEEAATLQQEVTREADGLRVKLAAKDVMHRCLQQEHTHQQEQQQGMTQQVQDLTQQLQEAHTAKAELQHIMRQQVSELKQKLKQVQQSQAQQARRSASPPLPHNTTWEAAPCSPGQLGQRGTGSLLYKYSSTDLGSPRHSPSRHGSRAAVGSKSGLLEHRRNSSPNSSSAGDWGALSAVGYVSKSAAAVIDATRRGKTLSAARRLPQPKGGKAAPGTAAFVGAVAGSFPVAAPLASKSSLLAQARNRERETERELESSSSAFEDAAMAAGGAFGSAVSRSIHIGSSSSSKRPAQMTLRSSCDPQLLSMQLTQQQHHHQQQQHQQQQQQQPDERQYHGLSRKGSSVLSTHPVEQQYQRQQESSSDLSLSVSQQQQRRHGSVERPSRSAGSMPRRHKHSLSCDLTAAAAALDAEITAALATGSSRHQSPSASSQLSAPQSRHQQHFELQPQPAFSDGRRPGSTTPSSAAVGARGDGEGSYAQDRPARTQWADAAGGTAATAGYAVCSLPARGDRAASHTTSRTQSPQHAGARDGSSWLDRQAAACGEDVGSYRSSSRLSHHHAMGSTAVSRSGSPVSHCRPLTLPQQQQKQQVQHQHLGDEERQVVCSPHSAGGCSARALDTERPLAATAAAAAALHARSSKARDSGAAAGSSSPEPDWRPKLQGHVDSIEEPYSPSFAVAKATQQRAKSHSQALSDPYSLPCSAEPSWGGEHPEQQPQVQHAAQNVAPQMRRSHAAAAAAAHGHRHEGQLQRTHQQQRQECPQDELLWERAQSNGGSRHLREDASCSSRSGSKCSAASDVLDELGAWEVPQFGSDSNSDNDETGSMSDAYDTGVVLAAAAGIDSCVSSSAVSEDGQPSRQLLQVLTNEGHSRDSSISGSSSIAACGRSRAQPPAGQRPSGGRHSRHHSTAEATVATTAAVAGGEGNTEAPATSPSAVAGSGKGSAHHPPLGASTRHASGSSGSSCVSHAAVGSTQQLEHCAAAGLSPRSSSSQQRTPRSMQQGEQATSGALHTAASSRHTSEGSSTNSTHSHAAAAATVSPRSAGVTAAAAAAAAAAVAAAGKRAQSTSRSSSPGAGDDGWLPSGFHTCAELLSPPSTCKAPRGSKTGVQAGQVPLVPLSKLAGTLSEDTLACVHDAPDDSWLMSYEPNKQQQQGVVHRVSSGRLHGDLSLSSWQQQQQQQRPSSAASGGSSMRGGGPQVRIGSKRGSSSTAAAGLLPQVPEDGGSGGGSRNGSGGGDDGGHGDRSGGSVSTHGMGALLDELMQGEAPSLLDLADL